MVLNFLSRKKCGFARNGDVCDHYLCISKYVLLVSVLTLNDTMHEGRLIFLRRSENFFNPECSTGLFAAPGNVLGMDMFSTIHLCASR
jgi:hypothetical protein